MSGKLTEAAVKAMKPAETGRTYKRADGDGLYIEVFADGKKRWRYQYQQGGKRHVMGLGVWDKVSLKEARARRNAAQEQVDRGIDPIRTRKATRNGTAAQGGSTFKALAQDWQRHQVETWSAGHAKIVAQRTEQYLIPAFGAKGIEEITPADMLGLVRRIEDAKLFDTARRVASIASQIFQHAMLSGLVNMNPAAAIRAALAPARGRQPMRYTVNPATLGAFLIACEQYGGQSATRAALMLAPYLLLRPGELRQLQWAQVDFEREELRLPIEAMKRRQTEKVARKGTVAHIVPLARQPLAMFRERVKEGGYVFSASAWKGRPLSNATLSRALQRLGDAANEQTIHGWRHTASTILHERGYPSHVIEKQLAHTDQNKIRGIYNHADYLEERRAMMQFWADWLDKAKEEAQRKKNQRRAETSPSE